MDLSLDFSFGALVVATLIMDPNTLAIVVLTLIASAIIYQETNKETEICLLIICSYPGLFGTLEVLLNAFTAVPYILIMIPFQCWHQSRRRILQHGW